MKQQDDDGTKGLPAERLRQIVCDCQAHPDEVITAILNTSFWLQGLAVNTPYTRGADDTQGGSICVRFSSDGSADGWIEVLSTPDPEEQNTVQRFHSYFGGGVSLRVRTALLILALAIKIENEGRKIDENE